MPNFIFLAFIYFIEGFIVYSYIQSIYSPKKSNSISFTITIFLYFTLLLVYRFVFNNEIFNTFLIIIINILIVFSLYKSSLKISDISWVCPRYFSVTFRIYCIIFSCSFFEN